LKIVTQIFQKIKKIIMKRDIGSGFGYWDFYLNGGFYLYYGWLQKPIAA
jgi:hypothetical protein